MYNPLDLARVVFDRLQNMECFCGCDCGFSSHDMRQKEDKKAFKREQIGQLDRHENEYIIFITLNPALHSCIYRLVYMLLNRRI